MLTLAISTYNRRPYLERCIQSLQTLKPLPDETIIVNDGSTDGTAQYLATLSAQIRGLRVITHAQNRGLSAGRNTAIAQAQGEIIAFTDDDCFVTENWIAELLRPFTDPEVVCAYGQVFYRARDYQGYFPERLVRNIGPRWPMGANIAYRKSGFTAVGNFDPKFFKYRNEDSEIAFRLARVGKLVAVPSAVIYHQAINWTCRSLLKSARTASVWPVLYRRYGNAIFEQTFKPPIFFRHIVRASDYFHFLLLPILIPALLVRYLYHGKRELRIFFCKWPIYLIARRFYIWREAIRNRVFMI